MPPDMTPAEQEFFATGVLPESLAAAAPAPTPAAAPVPTPAAAAPAPAPEADLQAQLNAERARRATLEESLNRLTERLPQPAAAAKPEVVAPDPTTDPLGAMLHQLRNVTENVTRMQETLTAQQTQTQQQQQFAEFQQNLTRIRTEFTKTQPDFPAAYAHLRAARSDDLRDVGVPENHIQEALLRDEIAATQNAIAQGKNPAQVIYNMAKRYGYAARAVDPADKIAALARGTNNGDSAPGRADTTSQLTFEGLKDAGDAELNKLVQDDKTWHSLVGNRSNNIF